MVPANTSAEANPRRSQPTQPAGTVYFDGDLDAAFAFGGQAAGRIDAVEPVATIIERTVAEFHAVMGDVAARWAAPPASAGGAGV